MGQAAARVAARVCALAATGTTLALVLAGCAGPGADSPGSASVVGAIGAENQYASVLGQIGGRYVHVTAVLTNPSTDPHTFEASPAVAGEISRAGLIVQNGLGYDTFMNRIEAASPNGTRKVITAQNVLGLPGSTPNPHLWYSPATMPAVARAIAAGLAGLQPAHRAYFYANLREFDRSLAPWLRAIGRFKARYHGITAAVTEPVADYLLAAMGIMNLTPFTFQADIMRGTDPAPQDISLQNALFRQHRVRIFIYNQQVTDALTGSIRQNALAAGIPVVGVYETMPAGHDYQSWMLAEVTAIRRAVADKRSTERL